MNNVPSVVVRSKKRVGRGAGSGKGFHTTGRGQKGQKARYTVHVLFEGVKTKKSLLHRLPMLPGKGRFKAQTKEVIVKLGQLEAHPAGDVTVETLFANKIVGKKAIAVGVKIIGGGEITKKFNVKVPTTQSVAKAVSAAGGTIS